MVRITVSNDLSCPKCGSAEEHPTRPDRILIRGYKVEIRGRWHSQCLVCSGFYDKDLNETPDQHDPNKGWFAC